MGLRSWLYYEFGIKLKNINIKKEEIKYSSFESIGDNCEFGLFLNSHENYISSFFRWTRIYDYALIIKLIENNFDDVFNFENLKPHAQPDLIIDTKYKLCFHSDMKILHINGKAVFQNSEAERKEIYIQEKQKVDYFIDKFYSNLNKENNLYVIKKNILSKDDLTQVIKLGEILIKKSKRKLLIVKEANNKKELFKVKKIKNNIYIGSIDKFSNYNRVKEELSLESWDKIISTFLKKIRISYE